MIEIVFGILLAWGCKVDRDHAVTRRWRPTSRLGKLYQYIDYELGFACNYYMVESKTKWEIIEVFISVIKFNTHLFRLLRIPLILFRAVDVTAIQDFTFMPPPIPTVYSTFQLLYLMLLLVNLPYGSVTTARNLQLHVNIFQWVVVFDRNEWRSEISIKVGGVVLFRRRRW